MRLDLLWNKDRLKFLRLTSWRTNRYPEDVISMTKLASMSASTTLRLDALVKQLDQCDGAIDKKTARRLLDNFPVDYSDVVPYVEDKEQIPTGIVAASPGGELTMPLKF